MCWCVGVLVCWCVGVHFSDCISQLNCTCICSYIHSKGFVYCDLKPSNILFNEYGVLKLGDFGLAHPIPLDTSAVAKVVLVWFGLVWFGLVWFGLVWFGLVCCYTAILVQLSSRACSTNQQPTRTNSTQSEELLFTWPLSCSMKMVFTVLLQISGPLAVSCTS